MSFGTSWVTEETGLTIVEVERLTSPVSMNTGGSEKKSVGYR